MPFPNAIERLDFIASEKQAERLVRALAQVHQVDVKEPLVRDRYVCTLHCPRWSKLPIGYPVNQNLLQHPSGTVEFIYDFAFVTWQEALESLQRIQSA